MKKLTIIIIIALSLSFTSGCILRGLNISSDKDSTNIVVDEAGVDTTKSTEK